MGKGEDMVKQRLQVSKRNCEKRRLGRLKSEKKIQDMTRQEYTSYVQYHYRNDPQWVRTMLISKYDREHKTKNNNG